MDKTRSILDLKPINFKDFKIETSKFQAWFKGRRLNLTGTEYMILYSLLQKPGRVCTREYLLQETRGGVRLVDRNIDVHIASLRRKLREGRALIETVRGFGYRIYLEYEVAV